MGTEAIGALRAELGDRVTIVAHHYQSEQVIRHAEIRGDSLELARRVASEVTSEHIVFCGVYFMAETAALLAAPGQTVHIPATDAECTMALMSPGPLARTVLESLNRDGRRVIPLAYVNSTLELKSVVGDFGGAVCTSANAEKMLAWALEQGDSVLFLPDKNLGTNTADRLGLPEEDRLVIDIRGGGSRLDTDAAARKTLLLWPGHCPIHTRFKTADVAASRAEYPDARIIVHPECSREVVQASDAAGSTSFLIRYANEAPDGTTLIVGTEINLVKRLAQQHANRLRVLPLRPSSCCYMAKNTETSLEDTLRTLVRGEDFPCATHVPEALKPGARQALETMLRVCA
ncbi:quinolinate synthase NadA [Phaeovibrio sulfidiphilus]|uniref:Quinolinate synthase n=2 Tax=Phaeovibrio sulfidiphilus TaxID=1220600 RepID=A0A8J6YYS8_9PROT|nr:quinolinate synthase NadA [Phaeovibrio sulfidiphilus]